MDADRLASMRGEYEAAGLIESEMHPDPFSQFQEWFDGVAASGLEQPNTFVLATADRHGTPAARALLMKGFDEDGLVFFTGLESAKSQALNSNPQAAATFVWVDLHRQVRMVGAVEQLSDEEADAYFTTRPRGAQIAAHASRQSSVVENRETLDERYAAFEEKFGSGKIPRPSHWGGWRLVPTSVEFWQGQPNRFHDRVRYVARGESWMKERLSP